MNIGFNIIEFKHPDLFREKISIIRFLQAVEKNEKLPPNFAILGLDSLLYFAEDPEEAAKYIKDILIENVNFLVAGKHIIQVVCEGDLEVLEDAEKPVVHIADKSVELYPVFGRMHRIDVNHFFVPLNIQS
jgi:hypothetical protein